MASIIYTDFGVDGSELVPPYIDRKYSEILNPIEDSLNKLLELDKESELTPIKDDLFKLRNLLREYAIKNSLPKAE